MSAPLRALLSDGRWHRLSPAQMSGLGDVHDEVAVGVRRLHVEVGEGRVRLADKGHCALCAEQREEIARLRARIAEIEGGAK